MSNEPKIEKITIRLYTGPVDVKSVFLLQYILSQNYFNVNIITVVFQEQDCFLVHTLIIFHIFKYKKIVIFNHFFS